MEIYKPVLGYETAYQISNYGNIKSMPKPHRRREKILKPMTVAGGYLAIDLGDGVSIKRHLVHRLMAKTFLNNPENKVQVNHINGIKSDNRLENLEWNTVSENQLHAIRTGLRTTVGVKNSQAKLKEYQVLSILEDSRDYGVIALEHDISVPTVCDIKKGGSWTHITGILPRRLRQKRKIG